VKDAGQRFAIGLTITIAVLACVYYATCTTLINTGSGLSPTLQATDRIWIRRTHEAKVGDIIFFSVANQRDLFLSRVVAKSGDSLQIRDGSLYVNGKRREEPDVLQPPKGFPETRVAAESYFVMDDRRDVEDVDSRTFGAIPKANVIGRVFLVFSFRDGFRRLK